ncbi:hypothetical protein JQN72_14330 [Phycicoccus sp. CSK15P-2]|uniref:hypothetical protein n=1 Tax=Phycicoccus sp. CSK15P-2 TaxID=2807627 RepID=UPI0019519636|nr:hypothetical protein [Phycicoccus sp. CSK15P-2]MBM6405419.1 hypothetical protein [Phycicoccus sp. CSK15P-2]
METAISVSAGIVGFVHGFLRDILAQLVGAAISWMAEALLSFGTLIPWICTQIGTRVAALTSRCSTFVEGLVRSGSKLGELLELLGSWGRQLLHLLDKVQTNPALHRPAPRHLAPGGPTVRPWSWTPPDGWRPRGAHSAAPPTFGDAMRDAGAAAGRDTGYTTTTNATDGGKNTHEALDEPED